MSVALNGLRKVKRFREREVALEDAAPVGFTPREADPDLKVRLAQAIDDLPEGYRAVFVMHVPGQGQAAAGAGRLRGRPEPMTDDDRLDQRIREAARAYNAPPETPRDAMWERIAAARRAAPEARVLPLRRRWAGLASVAAAAAAVLAIGVGIGRVSVRSDPVAVEARSSANVTAYRLAAQEHLGQSEAFLTLFRASLRERRDHRLAAASARQLLASNRLLLDSPAALDPATRLLLEDLELVLAEIAQLSPGSRAEDLELIRDGIERGDVMPRLRTAVPAGSAPTQGVL
jgi:hypothetical protein